MPSTRNPEPFLQSASNAAASTVSAPVDILAWLLRKGGVPIGDKPVGGSNWMEAQGLTKPVEQGAASVAGDVVGNVAQPAAGLAKGAATVAHLLPALPTLYGDRGAGKLADALRQSIGRAELEHATGASLAEIAKKTHLFPYPGGLGKTDSPQARWGFEMKGKLLPHVESMQRERLLGDIYDHPELYKAIPGLSNVVLHMGGPKGNLAGYAHYDDTAQGIGSINFNDTLLAKKDQSVFVQALHHEINHAINAKTDQLGSLGHGVRAFTSPEQAEHVYKIAQYLRKTDPTRNKLIDDLEKIAKSPGGPTTPEYTKSWRNSAGERLAEADADRTVGQRIGGEIPDINRRVYAGRPVSDSSSLAAMWSSLNPQGSVAKDTAYLLNLLRDKKMID